MIGVVWMKGAIHELFEWSKIGNRGGAWEGRGMVRVTLQER